MLTLGWMASFWLTSWDLKMRTSSLRTSSSSLTEVSCSMRTRYAGAPGAVTSGALFSLRALRNSFSSFFSFLFSDSSSCRCVNRQRIVHCCHPQLYIGIFTFSQDGRRILLEKTVRATLMHGFPGSTGNSTLQIQEVWHQVELSKVNGSLLHQPKFQSRIYSRPAQGVFPGLETAEFLGASLAQS